MTVEQQVWLKAALKVLSVTVALALVARLPGVREVFQADTIRNMAAASGWRGVLVVLAAGTLLPVAFLPRWPVAVTCGLAYGAAFGVLLSTAAGLLGAGVHYWFATMLLSRRERAALESWQWLKSLQASPHPFAAVVAVRLFPLSNFSVTNLVCGLLRIPFGVYLCASAFGMLPSTVVYVMAGIGALSGDVNYLIWAFALAVLTVPASAMLVNRQAQETGM